MGSVAESCAAPGARWGHGGLRVAVGLGASLAMPGWRPGIGGGTAPLPVHRAQPGGHTVESAAELLERLWPAEGLVGAAALQICSAYPPYPPHVLDPCGFGYLC